MVIVEVKVVCRIVLMSQMLDVPRSFYAWRNRIETATVLAGGGSRSSSRLHFPSRSAVQSR
ncbi:MAG: hypothetical protein QOF95_1931, partial [Pseudonocardiales bacterium]|nr:hypothetical protein [Pseudonocardiales bacterium]